jgi:hypothetical protein
LNSSCMGGRPLLLLLLLLLLESSCKELLLGSFVLPLPGAADVLWEMDLLLLGGRDGEKRVGRVLLLLPPS